MMVHIAFIDLKCGEQCCMEPVFALAMNYAQKHSQTGALSWFVRRYWTINASHVVIFLFYCAPTNSQPEKCLDASLIALLNHRDVFFNFYITVPDCYCQFVLKKLYAADMCKLRTGLRLHLIQDSCGEQ